ncbi:MAG: hypothetical protein HRU35_05965 [Rickettsiaceae bacterium]|nr:hypothetical protein [Rickettsiaceae bacterium]
MAKRQNQLTIKLNQFKKLEKPKVIDNNPEDVKKYIEKEILGGEKLLYPDVNTTPGEFVKINEQMQKICDFMKDKGLVNAPGLMSKFNSLAHKKNEIQVQKLIKETTENIIYSITKGKKEK